MMPRRFITLLYVLPVFITPVFAHSQMTTATPGKSPDRSLKIKSSGVPTFDFVEKKKGKNGKVELFKVTTIPRLNIGSERVVRTEALTPLRLPASLQVKTPTIKKYPVVPEYKWTRVMTKEDQTAVKNVVTIDQLSKIPTVSALGAEPKLKTQDPKEDFKEVESMSPDDFKYLQALIFLEKHKKYELAMGLFAELLEAPKHRDLAMYQYARTAFGLGMMSEFRAYMMKLAQDAKRMDLKEKAVRMLTENIQHLQITDIGLIDPMATKLNIDTSKNSAYLVRRAQFYLDKGDLTNAEQSLLLIDSKQPDYNRARLLWAFLSYRKGNIEDGLFAIDEVLERTQGEKSDELRSLAAMTKGRLLFQRSEFKESYKAYLMVDKSSPHWLPAMTEVAWTQILAEDYEGAAGNMFSLHTDFFKNAFAPETYVVRTVGYLNLCQYGDSLQVLNEMKKRYTPLKSKIDTYATANKTADKYYETVKNWAANPTMKEIDGLPRPFIVELARHPAFISTQKEINALEEEMEKFNNINIKLIQIEKDLRIEQTKLTEREYKSEADREAAVNPVKIQAYIAQKARNSIKTLRTQAMTRLDAEKKTLRTLASNFLKDRFQVLNVAVTKVIEQNDVLAYEIYSGAGEHIRYQMAGGDVNDKTRTELKAEDGKALNWKFKGEIWEDEIGHYRSSLKNVCPSDQVAANQ